MSKNQCQTNLSCGDICGDTNMEVMLPKYEIDYIGFKLCICRYQKV